ncbi:MAG: hypothetical protein JRS35_19690 [Deltaproteobacteria bacterium]|nr:hypothetical protein [Deltaproteobacteria bacterium]
MLNVTEATLMRWVRQGLVRSLDGHGQRFEQTELEGWARRRGLSLGAAPQPRPAPPEDLLAAAVERGAATAGVKPATALEAIEVAVGALPNLDDRARRDLLDAVLERERMASTGLGHGQYTRSSCCSLPARPCTCRSSPGWPTACGRRGCRVSCASSPARRGW